MENWARGYAFSDKRYSQQLHAIANPSEEDVALPSSSITIRLLDQKRRKISRNFGAFGLLNMLWCNTFGRHFAWWKLSLSSLSWTAKPKKHGENPSSCINVTKTQQLGRMVILYKPTWGDFTVLEFDSRLSTVPILVKIRSTTLRVEKRAGT